MIRSLAVLLAKNAKECMNGVKCTLTAGDPPVAGNTAGMCPWAFQGKNGRFGRVEIMERGGDLTHHHHPEFPSDSSLNNKCMYTNIH